MPRSIVCSGVSESLNNRRTHCEGGFTLLEVLIAFTILAVALVALMQSFSQGIIGSRVAEERAMAVVLARSKLAEVGRSIPLGESELSGEFTNNYRWRLVITIPDDTIRDHDDDSIIQLYDVQLEIERNNVTLAELRSLRAGSKP